MTREEIDELVQSCCISAPSMCATDGLKIQWLLVQLTAEIASQLADLNANAVKTTAPERKKTITLARWGQRLSAVLGKS